MVFTTAAAVSLAVLASSRPDRFATYSSVYAAILAPVPFFVTIAFRAIRRFYAWYASIDVEAPIDDTPSAGERPHDMICHFLLGVLGILWMPVAFVDVPLDTPCFSAIPMALGLCFVPMVGIYSLMDRAWFRLGWMAAAFIVLTAMPEALSFALPSLFSIYGFTTQTQR
ncbi:hypothetical protein [Paludisphaera rhizosphaerae]|uniref:hypothetical protein n=1 Tax=Paludisphaera rhizosphaerae TaxID=2711216 RepID=UPI0013ED73D5|nr:hypothetical protein [Paludisphaera rhizosphaerae]